MHKTWLLFGLLTFYLPILAQDSTIVVNDVSQLNPIKIDAIIKPKYSSEIATAVKNHEGPIAIGGGRYSMGGQTATEECLHIDMRSFDSILHFNPQQKEITVQTGITWRKIQEYIDPYNLSVKIMQTYANFTVGGSLSVNAHGRYIGQGPIVLSVQKIKIILANGEQVIARPDTNSDIFYGAIGGYGALGVITEASISLTDNSKVKREDSVMHIDQYKDYFFKRIRNDTTSIFHNADIYPSAYHKIRAVTYSNTQQEVTVPYRLKPIKEKYRWNRMILKIVSDYPAGKWLRQHVIDPILYVRQPVLWRNYEASYNVSELEPRSRKRSTYVLQEYFIPVSEFDNFYPALRTILQRHHVNVLNISIRHARKDPGTSLAWARSDVFAFVIYYKQGTTKNDQDLVRTWTQELIDAAITVNGTYYLPYQIHATVAQFLKAYPNAPNFFQLKRKLDPQNKFRNKLWEKYLPNP
jgi:FAD/FMN-containing dehydrogenase